MSRKKSPVVSPQPAATSILRRSPRLQGKPAKDPGFRSEPPPPPRRRRKTHRPEEEEEAKKSPGSSLRVSRRGGKEKSPPFSSTKSPSCSFTLRRSPRFSTGGGKSLYHFQSGNSVLTSCTTKSVSSRDTRRARPRPKTKHMFTDCNEEDDGKENRPCPNTKQICIDCDCYDDDEEGEVSLCLNEGKRIKLGEEGLKKTRNERGGGGGWTEELELALQGAYLTAKPSPNFWKKVSKMVPGKSAQECFDRVNADLITPRQPQPRSRANNNKSNLSPIPQFSLSASKPKTKRKGNHLSKKAIRHLLEKQSHMDQGGLGFDLFSVLEPGATSSSSRSFLSTPTEKGKSLPRIIESPRMHAGSSKDQTNLVSPPVLKQVKNKALHEKYIDHLHVREAKRKAEYNRLVGKENVRPMDNQTSVRAAKDALFFDVQDAVQKLKGLETENSSGSSEFCYGLGETDEEDESI